MSEHFTGALPPEYPAALPRLAMLGLSNLDVTGSLPGSWRNWNSLELMSLDGNQVP